MIPVLFSSNEQAFKTNGIGRLADCMTYSVAERINDFYTIELTYPQSGAHASELKTGRIVLAKPAEGENPQPFRIREVDRGLDGVITVYGDHISYDLAGYPVKPYTATTAATALSGLNSNLLISSPFSFYTDLTRNGSLAIEVPTSARAVLGGEDTSILAIYGGEYKFDRFDVNLMKARGKDNGVVIRYGKNLTEMTATEDYEGYYTGAMAYWEKEGTVVRSTIQYGNSSARPQRILITDHSQDFENAPTQAQLNTLASADLAAAPGKTSALTAAFAPLWQSDEFLDQVTAEKVSIGDIVTVVHEGYNISAKMKVLEYTYNGLTERYESLGLGLLRQTLADRLAEGMGGSSSGSGGGGAGVTYELTILGSTITLTGSDGSTSGVTIPSNYAGSASTRGSALRAEGIPFGEVDDTSTATAFTATVPGVTELKSGTCVMLKNGVVTSASGFTVNINGLGAKPCYTNLAAATRDTTIFNIAYTMLFVYNEDLNDGAGGWIIYRGYDANTNTIGYQLRGNSAALPAADKFYRYRLLFTSADGTKYVPANTSSSTNATAIRTTNTRPINPFGEIRYYGATAAVDATVKPSAAAIWQQYTLALGYSFNGTGSALTLMEGKPVYVRCTPQADGSAVMEYYDQTLPTAEDGKIYIYLGIAYSATNIELSVNHPVYYYKDGGMRLWTGV